ncbi:MAG: hypothetical protein OSJ62_02685, partial [Lachnospiraceae bacterium]|nr:hypothetical protein [Lachnospiraceae bacterium]
GSLSANGPSEEFPNPASVRVLLTPTFLYSDGLSDGVKNPIKKDSIFLNQTPKKISLFYSAFFFLYLKYPTKSFFFPITFSLKKYSLLTNPAIKAMIANRDKKNLFFLE